MEKVEAEYVRLAKLGQKDAFGKLIDRNRDVVFNICFSRCGNFTEAQDLTQEAFIRAYVNLEQLQDPEKFFSWLYRITCSVCSDWLRSRKIIPLPYDDVQDFSLNLPSVEDEVILRDMCGLLGSALELLPETQRMAARFHYLYGYTCEEIGKMLGVSGNVINSRIKRARKQLKNLLFDRLSEDLRAPKTGKSLTRKILSGLASYEKEAIFSHVRALKVMLEYHNERVDWDYLLGASGEAFCIYFSPSWSYMPKLLHSWDVLSTACESYGYRGEWHLDKGFEETLRIAEDSIFSGSPVAAPGINPSMFERGGSETFFWFVIKSIDIESRQIRIIGAEDDEKSVPYPWRERNGERIPEWRGIVRCMDIYPDIIARNPIFTIQASGERPSSVSVAVDSLKRAFMLAYEKPILAAGTEPFMIYGGIQALEEWGAAIRSTLAPGFTWSDSPENTHYNHYASVMQYTPKRLEVARRAASAYIYSLAEAKHELPTDHLMEAVDRYENVANISRELFEMFFDPAEEKAMENTATRLPKPIYYHSEEAQKCYKTFRERFCDDPGRRKYGAEIIDEIAVNERAAVRCIEKTLAECREIGDASLSA